MRGRRVAWLLMVLLALYGLGLGVRRYVGYVAHRAAADVVMPFSLESAIAFHRFIQVVRDGVLPETDPAIGFPEGIQVRETDTVGAEYAYAWLARLFPSGMPTEERLRWIQMLWFCLSIPAVMLWIGRWTGWWPAGCVAALFYATMAGSVARSLGQELSHEEVALPLLVAHLALSMCAAKTSSRRAFWIFTCLSAAALMLAQMTWDMIQFYVGLFMMASLARCVMTDASARERQSWAAHFAALLLAGGVNPYLRAHGFVLSPALWPGWGLLAAWVIRRGPGVKQENRPRWRAPWMGWGVAAIAMVACAALAAVVLRDAYGHFGELLWAKLRFLNSKPHDPALLTFNQRIMWTPALHSADLVTVLTLFPAALMLTFILVPLLLPKRCGLEPRCGSLVFYSAVSLIAFILFVRFHVFLALFSAGLLGLASWRAWASGWLTRSVALGALAGGWLMETGNVIHQAGSWGAPRAYYKETIELIARVKASMAPDPVLANFGVSGTIVAYTGCPVVLHPKFETVAARERVREYGDKLFKGSEEEFREWMRRHGVRYYIHSLGELSTVMPVYQMRYMVNALNPPAQAAVRKFELQPEQMRCFRMEWGNRKYRIFRALMPDDANWAEEKARAAETLLQSGRLDAAQREASKALSVDPQNRRAMDALRHAVNLSQKGFGKPEYHGKR